MRIDFDYDGDENIYLISDLHLFHVNVIPFCNRPFKNISHMNKILVDNWNDTVGYGDIVFFLGDFMLGVGNDKNKLAKIYYEHLKGKKYFIRGNHDRDIKSIPIIDNTLNIKYGGYTFSLGHYPKEKWKSEFSIHGHIHNPDGHRGKWDTPGTYNVSVENIDYKPIHIQELIKRLE